MDLQAAIKLTLGGDFNGGPAKVNALTTAFRGLTTALAGVKQANGRGGATAGMVNAESLAMLRAARVETEKYKQVILSIRAALLGQKQAENDVAKSVRDRFAHERQFRKEEREAIRANEKAERDAAREAARLEREKAKAARDAAREIAKQSQASRQALNNLRNALTSINTTFMHLSRVSGIAFAAMTLGLERFAKKALDTRAQFEMFERQLSTLLGSEAAGKAGFAEVKKYALISPLTLKETMKSVNLLLNYGFKFNDLMRQNGGIIDTMTKAAIFSQRPLEQVARSIEKIREGYWRAQYLGPVGITPQFLKGIGIGWDTKKNRPEGLDASTGPAMFQQVIDALVQKFKNFDPRTTLRVMASNIEDAVDYMFNAIGAAMEASAKRLMPKFQQVIRNMTKLFESGDFRRAMDNFMRTVVEPFAAKVLDLLDRFTNYLRQNPTALTDGLNTLTNTMKTLFSVWIGAATIAGIANFVKLVANVASAIGGPQAGLVAGIAALVGGIGVGGFGLVAMKDALSGANPHLATFHALIKALNDMFGTLSKNTAEFVGALNKLTGLNFTALDYTVMAITGLINLINENINEPWLQRIIDAIIPGASLFTLNSQMNRAAAKTGVDTMRGMVPGNTGPGGGYVWNGGFDDNGNRIMVWRSNVEPTQPNQPNGGTGYMDAGAGGLSLPQTGFVDSLGLPPTIDLSEVWQMPVNGDVSSGFGPRRAPMPGASTYHPGVDIKAGKGTPIRAAGSGTVLFVGVGKEEGNYVVIDHGNGRVSQYMHMLDRGPLQEGADIKQGDIVGLVGKTGTATGYHLHFGIKINGKAVDPAQLIGTPVRANVIPDPGLDPGSVAGRISSQAWKAATKGVSPADWAKPMAANWAPVVATYQAIVSATQQFVQGLQSQVDALAALRDRIRSSRDSLAVGFQEMMGWDRGADRERVLQTQRNLIEAEAAYNKELGKARPDEIKLLELAAKWSDVTTGGMSFVAGLRGKEGAEPFVNALLPLLSAAKDKLDPILAAGQTTIEQRQSIAAGKLARAGDMLQQAAYALAGAAQALAAQNLGLPAMAGTAAGAVGRGIIGTAGGAAVNGSGLVWGETPISGPAGDWGAPATGDTGATGSNPWQRLGNPGYGAAFGVGDSLNATAGRFKTGGLGFSAGTSKCGPGG